MPTAEDFTAIGFRHADPEKVGGHGEDQCDPFRPTPSAECDEEIADKGASGRADERGKGQENVVCHREVSGPDISKCSFDENKTWTASEAGEESTDGQGGERARKAGTKYEETEDGEADLIDCGTAISLAEMRSVNW